MPVFIKFPLDKLSPYKTICPSCKNEVKLSYLEFPDVDEDIEKKLYKVISRHTSRRFEKKQYDMFVSKLEPSYEGKSETRQYIATIAKVEAHKSGMFKQNCELSNKQFKVYHDVIFKHNEKTAGAVSVLGEEICASDDF